jgi:hypothetical protein
MTNCPPRRRPARASTSAIRRAIRALGPVRPRRRHSRQPARPDPAHHHPRREEPGCKDVPALCPGQPEPVLQDRSCREEAPHQSADRLGRGYWANLPTHIERVFAAKVGGKTYYIEIKHEGLLGALKSLGMTRCPLLRLAMRLTREYSRFQTAKNPEFVLHQLHQGHCRMRLEYFGREATAVPPLFANIQGKALYGASSALTEKGEDTQMRRWYEEWREAGGKISHYGFQDLDQIRKEIERTQPAHGIDRQERSAGAPAPARSDQRQAREVPRSASRRSPSTTRLAVYMAGREIGLSKAQAAEISRNATVDFNRRGDYGTS